MSPTKDNLPHALKRMAIGDVLRWPVPDKGDPLRKHAIQRVQDLAYRIFGRGGYSCSYHEHLIVITRTEVSQGLRGRIHQMRDDDDIECLAVDRIRERSWRFGEIARDLLVSENVGR